MVSYGHTLRAQGVVVSDVGHIGVYADPAGTTTCATIEVGTFGILPEVRRRAKSWSST